LPFCETVKIHDRDAVPQWSRTGTASSGPFTRVTQRRECLTYPLVRASDSPKSSFAPTCPTSAPLRVGPQSVSGQLPKDLDGGSRRSFGIPGALTAAGISFLGHLVPEEELGSAYAGLTQGWCSGTPRDCHVAHGGETTGVGASWVPGTMVLNLADRQSSASICRLATAGPYPPPEMPIDAGHYDGTSTEVHLRSPVRSTSVPVALGWYQVPLAVSLSSAPAVTGNARQGKVRFFEHKPGART